MMVYCYLKYYLFIYLLARLDPSTTDLPACRLATYQPMDCPCMSINIHEHDGSAAGRQAIIVSTPETQE